MSRDPASTFKKKVHPSPLTRSVDVGAPVRPLAEIGAASRGRVIVPLAVAAALALGLTGCSNKTPIERDGSREKERTHRASTSQPGGGGTDFVDVIKNFIDPDPEPARLAGEMAPVPVGSSTSTPPIPTVANTFISPIPNPPRLAGDVAEPSPPVPPTTSTVAAPTPPTPPTSITPNPGHPKLGGKPVSRPPGGTI